MMTEGGSNWILRRARRTDWDDGRGAGIAELRAFWVVMLARETLHTTLPQLKGTPLARLLFHTL